MTVRIPCIGDLHLQHTHTRNGDRLRALDTIIDAALALGSIGAWALLGDCYHQRSSIEDRNDLAPRVQRMADVAPVLIVYGNHDGAGDLEILARLKARYPIVVLARAGVVRVRLATGQVAATFGIPYPHKHALVAQGIPHEQLGTAAALYLDTIFMSAAGELQRAIDDEGAIALVLGHATIAGAVSSVGQPMGLDRDIAISAEQLSRLPDVPKIFGHIHKPQEIYGAHYAGSLCRNDFGECEDKRWLLVEYFHEDTRVTSRPIDVPPMFHVAGELSVSEGFTWRVTRGPDGEDLEAPRSFKGADVRVRYTYQATEAPRLELRRAEILAAFAEARTLEVEPIAIRERAHRAPEVQRAKTLPDKIRAFVTAEAVAWSPSYDAKLALLQLPDAGAFDGAVRQLLADDVQPATVPALTFDEVPS